MSGPTASIIIGTKANQATLEDTPIDPFTQVTITDPNAGSTIETVTITPSSTANGALSDPNSATDGGTFSNGVYTVTGSASAVTAALNGLVFNPRPNEIAPGQSVTTGFTISDTNSAGLTTTDSTASVVATAITNELSGAFAYTGQIVTYTVPTTGLYDILAYGAQGGGGGLGAEIGGEFELTAGEKLTVAVGGAGANNTGSNGAAGGGGGGGSFVILNGSGPLVVAGGGGGAGPFGEAGNDGQTTTAGASYGGGAGGTNGSGGSAGGTYTVNVGGSGNFFTYYGGGGGGGYRTSGSGGTGGSSFGAGLAGGAGGGGFGGGGGRQSDGAGGGGGGYSGGGGGIFFEGGGGGGSFDSGTNQVLVAGENSGNGAVVIQLIESPTMPTISGAAANQPTTDAAALKPFSDVLIRDPNSSATETVTVTPSSIGNGTLSDPNAATDGGTLSNGIYTVTGSAAAVTAALDGLVFTPVAHEVASGQTVTTGFTISDTNSADQTTTDATTSVMATAVFDPPTITGTVAGQPAAGTTPVHPFSGVSIADPDFAAQDSLTITLTTGGLATDGDGTLAGAGLTKTGTGTYTLAATSPASLTSEVDALTFTPRGALPGQTFTTAFTLAVTQDGATVTDSTTTVVATAGSATAPGTTLVNFTGSIVTYVVPQTGLYDILAFGAQGGTANVQGSGGLGGEAGGDFELTAGETLSIAVGGAGGNSGGGAGGGGGGGTFVALNGAPLVVAGGGGGGAPSNGGYVGYSLSRGYAGGGAPRAYSLLGGANGVGGAGGQGGYSLGGAGGGGGGFRSSGGNGSTYFGHYGINIMGGAGGDSFAAGLAGGSGNGNITRGGNGGFGGGGGGGGYSVTGGYYSTAVLGSGGGGGGYSGGGGGGYGFGGFGGNGGASFDGSTLTNADLVLQGGLQSGDGVVAIKPLFPLAPTITPATPAVVEKNQTTVIGTVAPAVAGDTLTLKETAGSGTLSLGPVQNGVQQVIYTAPAAIPASAIDAVSYQVTDQQDDESATGSANVQLDAGPSITPVALAAVQAGKSVEIATATPGLAGDMLTLTQTSPSASGTVSLVQVNGIYEVIYTAPSNFNSVTNETVTYGIADQHHDAVARGTAILGGNANERVSASGGTTVILGSGNDTVTLSGTSNAVLAGSGNDTVTITGSANTISLGSGNDTVVITGGANTLSLGGGNDAVTITGGANAISLAAGNDTVAGGTGDMVRLTGSGQLAISGSSEMVFLGSGSDTVTDKGQGLQLSIGPTAGKDVLANFGADLQQGVIHLLGGIGGYTTAQQAYNALRSDGHGGSLLTLGSGSLDITGVTTSQLKVSNIHIG